jgi:predicted HTH transcriptional regulator
MNFNIDLKELARRESEQVEWKENGDDIKIAEGIVKTISAFANDIANVGGGYFDKRTNTPTTEAERDLNLALENVENPNEKFFIEKDINFLNELKDTSKKPSK